jgi:hypothetical protein
LHPLDGATVEAAIARLTVALATAADDEIAVLVDERRALRAELAELGQPGPGVVRLKGPDRHATSRTRVQ